MKVNYTLFTPGPVDVPEDVLQETAQHILYHRDASFSEMLKATQQALNTILGSSGQTYIFTSSGTGALEAACSNVLSSRDRPVVATCGKFGQRWLELCKAYRIEPVTLSVEYGRSIPPEALEQTLKQQDKPTIVLTTLAETSTGALNDIKAFGEIVHAHEGYLVVDGIAGIGADACPQDTWYIDILIGASQKALMAPAGISFLSMSERASALMQTSDLPKYYFNLAIYDKFLVKHQTPWTPAVNIIYALKKGLDTILNTGLSEHLIHHEKIAHHVRTRVMAMGLSLLPEHPSNALTVIRMPSGVESTGIIQEIRDRYGILFANGQAELRGTILRIGHMGNYTIPKLDKALDILEKVLRQQRET
ncbi:alanine--glyoxylate aminotransferase family protein [candidate division WOR-3 bacterium]|nr:alanine--glyoxylate aminotransferase family protein [candidate division WOR-3 bacterium]